MSGAFPGNPLVGKKIVDLPMPLADGNQPWPGFQIPASTRREVMSGRMPMRALGPLPAVGRIENSVPPPVQMTKLTASLQTGSQAGVIRMAGPVGGSGAAPPRQTSGQTPTPMFTASPGIAALRDLLDRQAKAERHARNALTLGVLGIILGFLTGLPAIIYGHLARRRINTLPAPSRVRVQAAWGLALGYLTSITWIIIILINLPHG